MTRAERVGTIVAGVVLTAILVTAHLMMPARGTWQFNRILHYVWLGAAGLAGAGSVVFFLWPRTKLPRRDQERKRARDRILSVIIAVVTTFALVAFGEMRRDRVTHAYLASAEEDLAAINAAIGRYKADHGGALPANLQDLVPKYLEDGHLYYAYRFGPAEAPRAPAHAGEAEEPSYVLVPPLKGAVAEKDKVTDNPILVYQRPGEAWAGLVAALDRSGRTGLIGEDDAARSVEPSRGRRR